MINFNSKNEGQWFYFDESDHNQGGICLRELSTDQLDGIEKLTVTRTKKFKHGVAYDDTVTNKVLASKLRWRYCIVDWKDIQIDGVDAECNDENKVTLVKITDFVKFIVDCLEKLTETNIALEEARAKNLDPSLDGS